MLKATPRAMRPSRLIRAALCSAFYLAVANAEVRNPLPVPDLPGYRTLKCDFHLHTVFSDGEVWPTSRVTEAWRDGLDAIALTDHAGWNPHSEDVRADLQRPFEIARPEAERLGMVLIPGVELAEGNLHCNALFVTNANGFNGRGLADALRVAKSQGAFAFWNHPGWKRKPEWFPLIAAAYDQGLFQGAELVNGPVFYPEAYPWFAEKHLAILANSDAHAPMSVEYPKGGRPITLVFARTADADGIKEALIAGRSAAWMNGQIWGAREHLSELWRGAAEIQKAERRLTAGGTATTVQVRNRSAIPFQLRPIGYPEWLGVGADEIPPGSVAEVRIAAMKGAPAGHHAVELEFEVSNLHVSPDRNLRVRVPLRLFIASSAQ